MAGPGWRRIWSGRWPTGRVLLEPDAEERLAIVIEHLRASVAFYGVPLGLKMFRKHLGWYVEQAPWPADPLERRAAKSRLCRLDEPGRGGARRSPTLWRTSDAFRQLTLLIFRHRWSKLQWHDGYTAPPTQIRARR